jgi:RNA-directed DNA polymerase
VRYADDFVLGFQWKQDADAFMSHLKLRLARFGLELHPDKTRLLRFGRYACQSSHMDNRRKPENFVFLGFTHACGTRPNGKFILIRKTATKRRAGKMRQLKEGLRLRINWSVQDQWQWLCSVLRGYFSYFAVPCNIKTLWRIRDSVRWMWHKVLQRRSHKAGLTRRQTELHDGRFPLPRPRLVWGRQLSLSGR